MPLLFSLWHVCVIMTNLDCIAFMCSDDNQWSNNVIHCHSMGQYLTTWNGLWCLKCSFPTYGSFAKINQREIIFPTIYYTRLFGNFHFWMSRGLPGHKKGLLFPVAQYLTGGINRICILHTYGHPKPSKYVRHPYSARLALIYNNFSWTKS